MAHMFLTHTFYAAFETIDERDTKGGVVGVFEHKTSAEEAVKGKGWYGGNGTVLPIRCVLEAEEGVWHELTGFKFKRESVDRNWIADAEAKRKAALAKLTTEEKKLLGLEE